MNGEGYLQACDFHPTFGLYTVSHQPTGLGATGAAWLQWIHTFLIWGSVRGDDNDTQLRPWLGRHPVSSISAVVSSRSLLVSLTNIISWKTIQKCRCEVVRTQGLLHGQGGCRQELGPAGTAPPKCGLILTIVISYIFHFFLL